MTAVEAEVVWRGAEALRPFLVPLADLEPFPGNPRRGDVAELRGSLRRFGQVLPALADPALADGDRVRIVARHHLALAAAEEGWTHVAVIAHEFADEDEARAYLLADNRLADLGGYDLELLHAQLKAAQDAPGALDGTGYPPGHLTELEHQLAEMRRRAAPPDEFPTLNPDELEIQHRCPACGYGWSGNPAPGAPPAEPS